VIRFFESNPLDQRGYEFEFQFRWYAEGSSEYELALWAKGSSQYDGLKSAQAPGFFFQMDDIRSEFSEVFDHSSCEEKPAAIARKRYFSGMEGFWMLGTAQRELRPPGIEHREMKDLVVLDPCIWYKDAQNHRQI
jgi:hypothetical protein